MPLFFSVELPSFNEFLDLFFKFSMYTCTFVAIIHRCVNICIHAYPHLGDVRVYVCVFYKA